MNLYKPQTTLKCSAGIGEGGEYGNLHKVVNPLMGPKAYGVLTMSSEANELFTQTAA